MMEDANVDGARVSSSILHQGWLEHKSFHEYKWRRCWLTLQGNTILFYKTPNVTESPTGALKIKNDLKFDKKSVGSEKSGFKFELHTDNKICKFKAWKFSDREMWRAYLEGVATGVVSNTIDLPPELLVQIRQEIHAQDNNGNGRQHTNRTSFSSQGSTTSPRINDVIPSESGCMDDLYLEPTCSILQTHKFYNDRQRKDLPSWFFLNCSRERAEEILSKASKYGNTLMRKGSTSNSKLVISKKMEMRREEFSHYVVAVHAEGYKLQVENVHQPMQTLTEVMSFFIHTSGVQTTKPMTSNNLHEIGILPEHDYNPVIIQNTQTPATKDFNGNLSPRQLKAKTWSKSRSKLLAEGASSPEAELELSRRLSMFTEVTSGSPTPIPRNAVRNNPPTSPPPPPSPVPLPPRPATNSLAGSPRSNTPRILPRKTWGPTVAPKPARSFDQGSTKNFKKELEFRLAANVNKRNRSALPLQFSAPNHLSQSHHNLLRQQKQEEDIYDDIDCYQIEQDENSVC